MCDDSTSFEFLSVCSLTYLPYFKPNQEEGEGGGGGFVSGGTLQ
jgi:hypothetical protein